MNRIADWWRWLGWKRLVVGAVALPVAAVVVWWFVQLPTPPIENFIPTATTSPSISSEPPSFLPSDLLLDGTESQRGADSQRGIEPLRVAVHVVGAVQQPGVYHLAAGSRGDDAVRLAGGATSQADLKRVNLAAMLVDGQQLWIPRIGERIPQNTLPNTLPIMSPNAVSGAGAPPNAVPSTGVPALVDINQATVADLDRLPGIGPSTARAIVDHRTRNGPFASVDDLLAVRGIGPAKLAELRALVRV
jgi:competence protein ComEA